MFIGSRIASVSGSGVTDWCLGRHGIREPGRAIESS